MITDYAARAEALVGTRFRAQGRGQGGLDCIGVVIAAFEISKDEVRSDYPLRARDARELREGLLRHFRPVGHAQMRAGDVLLLRPADHQLHLAVRTESGFVHAHAGLRRVVETPGLPEWPLLGVYRKRRGC